MSKNNNIEQIRKKNIEKRALKQKNLEQKAINKAKKNEIKNKKLEKYAEQQTKRKEWLINKLVKKIRKKYDQKILETTKSLENNNKKASLEENQKNVDKNLIIRYYKFFQERTKKKYDQKIEKVRYDQKIEKILDSEAQEKINNIEIERHLNLEYYNKKITNFKNYYLIEKRLENKLVYLKNQKNNEVLMLEERMKSIPSTNLFNEVKDNLASIKSIFVFGFQIKNVLNAVSSHLRKYSMAYIFVFVLLSFSISTNGEIISTTYFINVLEKKHFIIIIGMGMLMVIVSGNIDLSVGALMGFLGAFSAIIFNRTGNIFTALILTLLLGALTGLVQGILIGYCKMPSFIVTLGGMLFFKGMALWLTDSESILVGKTYRKLITGAMPDVVIDQLHVFAFLIIIFVGLLLSIMMFFGRRKRIKYGIGHDNIIGFIIKVIILNLVFLGAAYAIGYSVIGLRYYIVYLLILAAIIMFTMQNTSFGRKIYAVGGNSKAAILSGINRDRIITYVFIIIGMMVGFASIVLTAFNTQAGSGIAGSGFELDVISSVFVGGASMQGGVGTVQGSIIGALIIGYIETGMNIMNITSVTQDIIKGLVLVSAVGYDIFANRKIG